MLKTLTSMTCNLLFVFFISLSSCTVFWEIPQAGSPGSMHPLHCSTSSRTVSEFVSHVCNFQNAENASFSQQSVFRKQMSSNFSENINYSSFRFSVYLLHCFTYLLSWFFCWLIRCLSFVKSWCLWVVHSCSKKTVWTRLLVTETSFPRPSGNSCRLAMSETAACRSLGHGPCGVGASGQDP